MLCTTLHDPGRVGDPRYVAEPKFDGQRDQVHVATSRTVAVYSRLGRSLLTYPGLAGRREARWPVVQAMLAPRASAIRLG